MTKAKNNIEIRVLGQMRSGNHAIISWLHSLYPNKSICFLNNIRHGDYDPFENYAQKELTGMDEFKDTETLRNRDKDVLIYSYEDRKSLKTDNIDFVSSVFNKNFEMRREDYLGTSTRRLDIIIIRDPFNCLASRIVLLRRRGGLGGLENMHLIKENWKIVARRACDIEKVSGHDQIVINYNRWLFNNAYRKQLSELLMVQTSGKLPQGISHYGHGSSFTHKHIAQLSPRDLITKWHKLLSIKRWIRLKEYLERLFAPSKLNTGDLLIRWKLLSEDDEYRELFRDSELLALSEELFGEITGTREFVEEVCGKTHSSV
jgi:hypothetical protein